MAAHTVVALAIVLQHQLPVGLLQQGLGVDDLAIVDVLSGDERFEVAPHRIEWRRGGAQADEDVAGQILAVDRCQAELRLVEVTLHVSGAHQLAGEIITPLMIWARETFGTSIIGEANSRATMAATVVKGPYVAVVSSHHDEALVAQLHRDPVPGAFHLATECHEQPRPAKDVLHVEIEDLLRCVERLWQAPMPLAVPQ